MTPELPYTGHVLTSYGLKPDPSKMRAVVEMPSPANKPALLRFLGMVNYMSKFIPNLANLTQPLRELLHKEVECLWSERQEKCFQAIKENLVRRMGHSRIIMLKSLLQYQYMHNPMTWGMATARG